jgi:hypothetical protein
MVLRFQWVLLTSCCIGTSIMSLASAASYLGGDCATYAPGWASFVVAMLVAYLPVVIFLGLLLLAIISATCIKLRRRQIRQPLLFARIYKVLHWLILNFFRIGCHRAFIAVHILISASCWSAEPFLLLSSWHQVSPDCRDSRVIGITCAGLEIGLNLYRLLICGAVEKELRYEDALLRVDAASVKFMEVTKCNTCGMQFFGNPENTEGM